MSDLQVSVLRLRAVMAEDQRDALRAENERLKAAVSCMEIGLRGIAANILPGDAHLMAQSCLGLMPVRAALSEGKP